MEDHNKKKIIVKNNRLIEAQYKLSLQEQKIILSVVSMIKYEDKEFHKYKLSLKNFMRLANIEGKGYNARIIKFSKALLKKPIVITKDDKKKLVVNWFSAIEEIENGVWCFSFDPSMKPYLLELQKEFTNYQLRNIIQLNSKYSIRLYEILKQYLEVGERFVKLTELRLMIGIEEKQYKFFNDFKMRILERAKKELSEKTDIQFTWKPVKTVRKITAIHFFIQKNKVRRKVYGDQKSKEIQELINFVPERHRNKKIIQNTIEIYLKKKGFEYVKDRIEYSNLHAKKNYGVFLKRSLKEKWDFEIDDIEKIKSTKRREQEEEQLKLFEKSERDERIKMNIKIVENLVPEQEQALRNYIFTKKNKKEVSQDIQNLRAGYKTSILVAHIERYLISIMKGYIESLNGVSAKIDEIWDWFQGYTKIKEIEIFNNIIKSFEISKE